MGHSQAEKSNSRDRILKMASEQIRDQGLESLSVNKLMRSVELTHGGFYGHFASRSELLNHALERALQDSEEHARYGAADEKPRSFSTMVRGFLSRNHRDNRKEGCAIVALASDVGRAEESTREVMEGYVEQYIQRVQHALASKDEAQAMLAVSAMVGAVALSRVIVDPKRADALLRGVRDQLLAMDSELG